MAETMNVVVKEIVIHNNSKQIYVANGMIFNIIGKSYAAVAQLTPEGEATEVELYNALGPDDIERWPLAASLGQMADFTEFGEGEKYLLGKISKEDCSDADYFDAAKEVEAATEDFTPTPWGNSLDNAEAENKTAYKLDNSKFDSAVDFLAHCKGEYFLELVRYARVNGNRFFNVKEVADIINADDAYCSAIIKLSRHLGDNIERKAFELFDDADENAEDFLDFWKALQVINYFC